MAAVTRTRAAPARPGIPREAQVGLVQTAPEAPEVGPVGARAKVVKTHAMMGPRSALMTRPLGFVTKESGELKPVKPPIPSFRRAVLANARRRVATG